MKTISADSVIGPLKTLIEKTLTEVDADTLDLIARAEKNETNELAKWSLRLIAESDRIAKTKNCHACQDCGQAVLFVDIGREVYIDGDLDAALNEGIALGYKNARKSVCDPLTRLNTNTNCPGIIHYAFTDGDSIGIGFLAKGAGAENMSRVFMLTPADGKSGIINSVAGTVSAAGSNPCPPLIIGVGIGGTMEKCAILGKRALLRKPGSHNPDPETAELESEILAAVNGLGIGVQGFGGKNTALSVAVETAPTHIGMLPVAVNLQCHSSRHGKIVLS
jgi:fumarate hydratase subunit alpha